MSAVAARVSEGLLRAAEELLASPQGPGQLRLATFNIGANRDRFYDNEKLVQSTKRALEDLTDLYRPNVLCCQEISHRGIYLV